MKKGTIIALCIVGALTCVGVLMAGKLIGAYNTATGTEKRLFAQNEQKLNNLSQYSNKIVEMAQIPEMYKADYGDVLKGAISGTYGPNGSEQAMLWLKERNIDFDSFLYANIQTEIVAGRNAFENEQKKLLDMKAQYETMLDTFPNNFVLKGLFGFPKINMDDMKVIKSGMAVEAQKTGVENGMKLRK